MSNLKKIMPLFLIFMFGCSSSVTRNSGVSPATSFGKNEYKIQPGDMLDIKFFYNPELNEAAAVRSDGKITLQLVNDVVAAGLTPSELTSNLKQAYAAEIVDPNIAVIVRISVADKVYVDGEVNKAGIVTLSGPITAAQSIAQAGGMKDSANPTEVVIIRKDMNNEISTLRVNVADVRRGVAEDLLLRPNDIVYVPKSSIADVNTWIDLYIRNNVPLPIGVGYSIR